MKCNDKNVGLKFFFYLRTFFTSRTVEVRILNEKQFTAKLFFTFMQILLRSSFQKLKMCFRIKLMLPEFFLHIHLILFELKT